MFNAGFANWTLAVAGSAHLALLVDAIQCKKKTPSIGWSQFRCNFIFFGQKIRRYDVSCSGDASVFCLYGVSTCLGSVTSMDGEYLNLILEIGNKYFGFEAERQSTTFSLGAFSSDGPFSGAMAPLSTLNRKLNPRKKFGLRGGKYLLSKNPSNLKKAYIHKLFTPNCPVSPPPPPTGLRLKKIGFSLRFWWESGKFRGAPGEIDCWN